MYPIDTVPTQRRRLRLFGLLTALGLLLAACGDSADDVEAAIDDATETAEDAGVDTSEVAEQVEEAAEDAAEDLTDGADTQEVDAQTAALAESLRANGLSTLASLVEQVDIREIVGEEEFTFFAPNDEAFLGLTADDTADLLADPENVPDILRNHLVEERLDAAQLTELDSVTTAGGATLAVAVDGDTVTVGPATVVATDIEAGDGVIHAVDQVLLP